jgi:hypothetical protein
MVWPAVNGSQPFELLWEQLDRMVCKKCPSSQSNLWEVLQEEWGEISSDYLNKLTTRMSKVCKAANGGFVDKSKVWRTQLLFLTSSTSWLYLSRLPPKSVPLLVRAAFGGRRHQSSSHRRSTFHFPFVLSCFPTHLVYIPSLLVTYLTLCSTHVCVWNYLL